MSNALRIALVAEGPTDRLVIEAALRAMLAGRPFVLTQLQPEGSLVFGSLGAGWPGVYRWCKQAVARGGGQLSDDKLLFENFDLLLLHLDADVADMDYASGSIAPETSDAPLRCAKRCPPPSETTDALRAVLSSWCGSPAAPARTIFCMPSKSTEAWVVAALFPADQAMRAGIECFPNPEDRLGQQTLRKRIRKNQRDYLAHTDQLQRAWSRIAVPGVLAEAARFQIEMLAAVNAI